MTEADANTVEESTDTESSSESIELQPIEDEDGFVSTTEFRPVEKDETDETPSEDAEQNTSEAKSSEKTDFHEHPRFQELIREKNDLAERLARLEKAKEQKGSEKPKSKYTFQNIMEMDDEDISDKLINSPKQFLANLVQQAAHEITTDIEAENKARQTAAQKEAAQQTTVNSMREFFKDKEDGIAMLKDGTIQNYIRKHPIHNPISAYYELAGEKQFETRLEKELKAQKDKINRELKAAGRIKPIKSSSTTPNRSATSKEVATNKSDLKKLMLRNAKRA